MLLPRSLLHLHAATTRRRDSRRRSSQRPDQHRGHRTADCHRNDRLGKSREGRLAAPTAKSSPAFTGFSRSPPLGYPVLLIIAVMGLQPAAAAFPSAPANSFVRSLSPPVPRHRTRSTPYLPASLLPSDLLAALDDVLAGTLIFVPQLRQRTVFPRADVGTESTRRHVRLGHMIRMLSADIVA